MVTSALAQEPLSKVRLVRSYEPRIVAHLAIGLRKGEAELRDRIDAALARLKAEGRLDRILKRWNIA